MFVQKVTRKKIARGMTGIDHETAADSEEGAEHDFEDSYSAKEQLKYLEIFKAIIERQSTFYSVLVEAFMQDQCKLRLQMYNCTKTISDHFCKK